MPEISELATNIHKLSTMLGRVGDRALQQDCGFGISQFKILWMLRTHEEGVLQTTIASWLNQTEAAISRQISLLEQEDLIVKQVDPNNRRNHVIQLTQEGRKFADEAISVLIKEYKPSFDVLSVAEQDLLNKLLEKVFFAICSSNSKTEN